jgi:hypothetical protein
VDTAQVASAAGATVLATAFAAAVIERWAARRRRHDLAWGVALVLFAGGAASLWVGAAAGWSGPSFRAFYVLGAVLNVPVLALGTIYLLGGTRRGDRWAAAIALASAFAAGVIVAAPLRAPIPPHELPRGSDVFGPLPRVLAATASAGGAAVVFGGAAWSAWRLRRSAAAVAEAGARRRFAANLLIATGTVILSAGGLANSVLDEMTAFSVTLVAGIAPIFAGFLLATAAPGR